MPAPRDVFRAPKGTLDVLPPASARWEEVVARFAIRARRAGYGLVVTPVFEHEEVFRRVGETTDVVSKEMYTFTDRGGRALALRPEGTASVVRAYVEHRPPPPWKVWYVAPNFRAERPQKGRYRQHWQVGVEALGVDDPAIDVDVVALLVGFATDLGLRRTRLLVNSMGDSQTRARYREVLLDHWRAHATLLGDDMARAEANPLRILDTKRPDWSEMLASAPRLDEHLSDAAADHFAAVRSGLDALGVAYELDPRLVRGFDYYTGTVFELESDALDAAQRAVGGGGRFDRLAEEMGGPPTPGIGFGAGIERLLLACDAEGVGLDDRPHLDVFVVDAVGGTSAAEVLASLRAAGLAADRAYGGRSVRKQWGAADRSGAAVGVMLAPEELGRGAVVVKDLRTGAQEELPVGGLGAALTARVHRREGDSGP